VPVCDFHGKCYGNKYILVVGMLISYESLVSHELILFKPLKINKRVESFSCDHCGLHWSQNSDGKIPELTGFHFQVKC